MFVFFGCLFVLFERQYRFLQIPFFHRYLKEQSYAACGDLGASLLLCLSSLFWSLIFFCRFALTWPRTHPSSHKKKKADKVGIFSSEAAVCRCFLSFDLRLCLGDFIRLKQVSVFTWETLLTWLADNIILFTSFCVLKNN